MNNRLFGATLLITGCCIGAGMLGLPVVSALSGFIPSTILFFLVWLFMMTTGLLLMEVTLSFPKGSNLMTMTEATLGPIGKKIFSFFFLFLFYSLMVAYVAASGALCSDFAKNLLNISISTSTGSLISTIILGIVAFIGTIAVDRINQLFMLGLVISYAFLVSVGLPRIHIPFLLHMDWTSAYIAVPVMVVSFGYHNLVPSIVDYLERDRVKIRKAIMVGSAIPLLVYLLWDGLIMGLVPLQDFHQALAQGNTATSVLTADLSTAWVDSLANYFAFFALVTSFLGVSLSFVDFLADGLSLKNRLTPTLLVLIPSFLLAENYPHIFLTALGVAGGFSAVILFGILPALMMWKNHHLIKGGKTTLLAIIAISLSVIGCQLFK
jgi:tyrosine-specific transport protein